MDRGLLLYLGISSPQYTQEELEQLRAKNAEGVTVNGKHYTMYEATQHQRQIERAIRKQKWRVAAGLRQQSDRLFVAAGSGKTPQSLANPGKSDIIEADGAGSMGVDIEIDKFTPCLEDAKTGEIVSTTYSLASEKDLKGLKGKGWAFRWTAKDLDKASIYKLNVKGNDEIQGLIAITPYERDKAMYVNIVESAPHNKGADRQYYGVGGHLFAIAAQESKRRGFGGFLFLDAKNMELVEYYQKQLGAMWIGGIHQYRMFIDEAAAHVLLNKYTLEVSKND